MCMHHCKYYYMILCKFLGKFLGRNSSMTRYTYLYILCRSYRCIRLGNCQYIPRIRLGN